MLEVLKNEVYKMNMELPRNGLVYWTSGNVSGRDVESNLIVIKPSGIKYEELEPEDMVVVNLYAFEKTVANPGCTLEDAVENIDIGGHTLLRAAAKNYPFVTVLTDPSDYVEVIKEMTESQGHVSEAFNFRMAKKVFKLTSHYDTAISRYLETK